MSVTKGVNWEITGKKIRMCACKLCLKENRKSSDGLKVSETPRAHGTGPKQPLCPWQATEDTASTQLSKPGPAPSHLWCPSKEMPVGLERWLSG